MGQKTNPLGFRLGITQDHKSSWYAKFNNYSELLNEDDKILLVKFCTYFCVNGPVGLNKVT